LLVERVTQVHNTKRWIRDANSQKRQAWLVLLLSLALSITFAGTQAIAQRHKPVTDDTIADQVRLKLVADPDVKGAALDVTVKVGVVTLLGRVPTERARSKAEKLAKKIKGVKSVSNQLVVSAT
jgi:5S rRNA maturation endonuclease (ribonuclease M5)